MNDALTLFEKAKQTNLDAIRQLEALTNLDTPDLSAINNLGICYEYGYSVVQDQVKAITLYRRAADLGDDTAMCNLGLVNQAGRGTPINIATASYWYLEAAKKKTTNPIGTSRAIRELEELSKVASPNAIVLNNLAVCYECGYGVIQDYAKTRILYRRAADLGDDTAMCNLGVSYQEGRGTPIDITTATYWYLEAAKKKTTNPNGSPRAIDQLEKLVREVSPHREAIISLAICYEQGYVVTKNSHKATELLLKLVCIA
jgi:TPR repeat protein